MPSEYLSPGVCVEELPSGVHPIEGVPTSCTAFLGRTPRGSVETPTPVGSLADFESLFGPLAADCPLTRAVAEFFANGGTDALIVRLENDGAPLTGAAFIDPALESERRGLWALERAARVNLIVIPPPAPGVDVPAEVWNAAIRYAAGRRAFVLVDPPSGWRNVADAVTGVDDFVTRDPHAALYFPHVVVDDPLDPGRALAFPPSAMVAGVYARTDAERGVWKAPAGAGADLRSASGFRLAIGADELGALNARAVNCLRELPGDGRVVWGARTLVGTDAYNAEWKYVNIRRLMLYIEASIEEGTQWAVFEPNDDTLWPKLTRQVQDFLRRLWRAGAFQGVEPEQAFFARCDRTTMTQDDIDNGRTIIEIGVAPLRPAEFVIVRITQRRR